MRGKYATVKIPLELAGKLDALISTMGYRSRAEIVNDAVRRFIDDRIRLGETTTKEEEEGSQSPQTKQPQILITH